MKIPLLHLNDPKALIRAFIGGSLAVIVICLGVTAAIFTYAFVGKETQRIGVAKQQVLQFFQFEQTIIGEEMWTRNFESIAGRVARIAAQLGNAEYNLYLADEAGTCLLHSRGNLSESSCSLPAEFRHFGQQAHNPAEVQSVLRFDEKTQRNVYMTPVFVGPTLKGFLYVSLTDPYHFYRGNTWSLVFETFFPAIIFILCVLILWFYICNRLFLKPYLTSLVELQREQALVHTAQQVAHDLKSPLATLLQVTETLKQVPAERLRLIRNAVATIRDIANSLIEKKSCAGSLSTRPTVIGSGEKESIHLLSSLIDVEVAERRTEYRSKTNIEISAQPSAESYGLFAKVQATEFRRMLSNLINNAIEAVGEHGQIVVNAAPSKDSVVISVTDNGHGIPRDRMASLGTRGATFGKPNGRGLGLFHAKETAKAWGGELKIESTEGKGTIVKVILPRIKPPKWFVPELSLAEDATVVVLDDDCSIHQVWADKIGSLKAQRKNISLVPFSRADDVVEWKKSGVATKSTLYLCDYQLNQQARNGLDVIEELGIQEQSILVTGHFEEREIRERCAALGVRLVPKELIGFLPVHVSPNLATAT